MKESINKLFKAGRGESAGAYTWFGIKKTLFIRLAIAVVLFIVGLIMSNSLIFMLLSFLIIGYDVFLRAVTRLANERTMGEELLFTLAALMAFVINAGYEAPAIMIIYQVGFILRSYAAELSRATLQDKASPFPSEATVLRAEERVSVPPDEIQVDEILIVMPGESFPVDCEVSMGESSIELSPVLGRTRNQEVREGDAIPAGAVNVSAEIRVRALSTLSGSAFAQAMSYVSDDNNPPCALETTIGRYSAVFAPFTIGISVVIALVLLIFTSVSTEEAIHRALVFLLLACPTALWAPVPLIYLAGLFRTLKKGAAVKGAAVLESVSRIGAVVFDKNDLLSGDEFRVTAVRSERLDPKVLLKVAAHAAANSTKSQSEAIVNAYEGIIDNSLIQRFEEFRDGIAAVIDGVVITMGGRVAMDRLNVPVPEMDAGDQSVIYLALNGRYAGCILLSQLIRNDARETIRIIESVGCDCVMLSDDTEENTRAVASSAGISEYYAQCMPIDHLERLQEIKERFPVNSVLYIGDGAKDTSSLDAADIGVCVNGLYSRVNLQAGSIAVMDTAADAISDAVEIGRITRKAVRRSLIAVLLVKGLLFLLSLFGVTYQLWFAAMVDAVIGVAGILYSSTVWNDKASKL